MEPFVEDGELVGAGTSYGLLTPSEDRWVWAPTGSIDPRDVRAWERAPGADRVLVGSTRGVYYSRDDGCSWSEVSGALGGTPVSAFALGEGRSPTLFAATERSDGANSVWRSRDGGASWEKTSLEREDTLLGQMFGAGGVVAVEGFVRDQATWRVWLSEDGGASWMESPDGTRLAGVSDGGALVAVERGSDWDVLAWDGQSQGDVLATLPERPEGAGKAGDTLLLWDGEQVVDADGAVSVDSAHCLLPDVSAGAVWLCESTVEDLGGHFLRIDAGAREALVDFQDVTPIECPEGSTASELTLERWASLNSQGVGSRDSEGSLEDDTGGGCGCGGGGAAAALFVLCLGWSRRIA